MWWRKGWLFNSLNYQVEKSLRESLYGNTTFEENSWSWWEKQVVQWSARPVHYFLLVSGVFVLATILGILSQDAFPTLNAISSQKWRSVTTWVSPVLGAQVTVIGIIFPLVVGFVGVLLQDKSANRALWQIYSRYSGFMFAGLSGLALAGLIIAARFAHPWISPAGEAIVAAAFCLWFVFNLILVGWFLHATFRFIATSHRSGLVLRYCINEMLATEVASRLSELLPGAAANLGLLGEVGDDDSRPKIGSIYFPRDDDQRHYIEFRQKKYLANIYFRGLQLACFIWRIQALLLRKGESDPEIVFPISGRTQADRKWLFAVTRNIGLWAPVRWIARASYAFSRSAVFDFASIDQIIDALVGDVEDSLRKESTRQYDYALDELLFWHREVLSAGSFINDEGERDNWVLLSNRLGFGRSIADELSSELYQISRTILQRLTSSTRFFERFCNYFIRVYGWRTDWVPSRLTNDLISGHYRIWPALMQWQQDGLEGQDSGQQKRICHSAVRSFVGSWEAWPSRLEQYEDDWDTARRIVEPYIHHLQLTARQIVAAARSGADEPAEWAVDVLNNWYGTAFRKGEPYQFGWRTQFIVYPMLSAPVESELWRTVLNDQCFSDQDSILIAMCNSWLDTRLATAAYLIKRSGVDMSQVHVRFVNALVAGQRLKAGGSSGRTHTKIRGAADVLEAYIRQRWFWEYGDDTYSAMMDSAVSSLAEMEREEWVSGRVYSGWGSQGVASLTEAYVAIAIALASAPWSLSKNVVEFLFTGFVGLQNREELIRNLREDWLEPTEETLSIARLLSGNESFQEKTARYTDSVEAIIQQLEEQNVKEVVDSAIDTERLIEFGKFASFSGFHIRGGQVPQSFFDDVEYVDELGEGSRHQVRISGYERSNISEGLVVNRAANEEEWLDRMVADAASVKLFRDVFQRDNFIEVAIDEFHALIDRAVRDAESMVSRGLSPVLFVGPRSYAHLLETAMWPNGPDDEKLDYELTKMEGYPDSYICHLQGIEVYGLPFRDAEFCILSSRNNFTIMRVRRLGDGRYVDAEFFEYAENKAKGDLVLSFWLESRFGHEAAYKYVSPEDAE